MTVRFETRGRSEIIPNGSTIRGEVFVDSLPPGTPVKEFLLTLLEKETRYITPVTVFVHREGIQLIKGEIPPFQSPKEIGVFISNDDRVFHGEGIEVIRHIKDQPSQGGKIYSVPNQ